MQESLVRALVQLVQRFHELQTRRDGSFDGGQVNPAVDSLLDPEELALEGLDRLDPGLPLLLKVAGLGVLAVIEVLVDVLVPGLADGALEPPVVRELVERAPVELARGTGADEIVVGCQPRLPEEIRF